MSLHSAGVVAGMVSTALFVTSYLPMLVKAARTRDLSSYSVGNLAVANVGNLVHTIYVVSLPVGPIWVLHGFYLGSTALMMCWWLRYRETTDTKWEQSPSDGVDARRLVGHEVAIANSQGLGGSPDAGNDLSSVGSPPTQQLRSRKMTTTRVPTEADDTGSGPTFNGNLLRIGGERR